MKATPKKKKNLKRQASDSDGDDKTKLQKFAFEKSSGEASAASESSKEIKPPVTSTSDINLNWLHNRLEFLQPDKIRDIKKRKADDPDYDSRTLHIPGSFLDKQTPAMRQWWILKSTHMDSVLFFKVGKFYELYHMDAVVGVNHLGFSYMKVCLLIFIFTSRA